MIIKINKNLFLRVIILSAFFSFLPPCVHANASDGDKIIVEKSESSEVGLITAPDEILSAIETEFNNLTDKLSRNITFEIENASASTDETAVKRARIMVKDTQAVRIETSLPNGMEMIITSTGGDGWIYFPKTNTIMELNKNARSKAAEVGGDFLSGFSADRAGHIINKTLMPHGGFCYEIARKDGRKVVTYHFSKEDIPQKITIIEKNKNSEEILIKKADFGVIDDSLFIRPKNAFKMPFNEFPDFDY
jgi:outer membrane lipoprotein-sorting protein